ncbi:ribosomal RNA processing protein 36 homolog [Pseudochaenichthys georgianus]|uniref:ribosomal RNA processing protein 36 homolog n=1 Tax=Pseudochaenichthys georgianus TaxID=52239 RepID=UPI00146C60CC|nr:ribosomal RNA processing protein 36 homolog [Pseudochaenichthys georgianus]
MTGKGKQPQKKKKNMAANSSDDEDSDVERNFALLTKRGGTEVGESFHQGEEESSDDEEEAAGGTDEEEEGADVAEKASDGGDEEEAAEGGEEEQDEDSDASDDDEEDDEEDGDEDAEEAGGSSEIQTREDIKKELSNMSFEEIMKLQNKVGTKVYNEVAYGSQKTKGPIKKKRLNKNRPMEISAKRRAPFLRKVVSAKKPTSRDPRFDDLSGEYKPEIFVETYKFINDIKLREKEIVKKQLKRIKPTNVQKKEKLQFLLKRMENQERARKSQEEQRERELQFKRQQRERASQGDRPFFLKNSEKKKLQLAEKYQELKKTGKLDNFLSKKRKRNAGKDRRKLPPRELQGQSFQGH